MVEVALGILFILHHKQITLHAVASHVLPWINFLFPHPRRKVSRSVYLSYDNDYKKMEG